MVLIQLLLVIVPLRGASQVVRPGVLVCSELLLLIVIVIQNHQRSFLVIFRVLVKVSSWNDNLGWPIAWDLLFIFKIVLFELLALIVSLWLFLTIIFIVYNFNLNQRWSLKWFDPQGVVCLILLVQNTYLIPEYIDLLIELINLHLQFFGLEFKVFNLFILPIVRLLVLKKLLIEALLLLSQLFTLLL